MSDGLVIAAERRHVLNTATSDELIECGLLRIGDASSAEGAVAHALVAKLEAIEMPEGCALVVSAPRYLLRYHDRVKEVGDALKRVLVEHRRDDVVPLVVADNLGVAVDTGDTVTISRERYNKFVAGFLKQGEGGA